ncbi:hypothetical protein HMI55_003255, partial [Coelomomyces lativittatus]
DKKGLELNHRHERVLSPKPYVTADEKNAEIVKKVIVLQCFFRKIFAIRKVRTYREMRAKKIEAERKREEMKEAMKVEARKQEIERRVHPQTASDFSILYSGLESWREDTTHEIHLSEPNPELRRAKLKNLLNQEASLIQQICMLKKDALEKYHHKAIEKWVDKIASPKRWPVSTHGDVQVDTPATLRARELATLYHDISGSPESVDARLKLLLLVKNTVKQYDCNVVSELIPLINREGDLLCRGRDGVCLQGLRNRITGLFLKFLKNPEFNPEAASGQIKVPTSSDSVYVCKSCERYLPSTQFQFSTTTTTLGLCRHCRVALQESSVRKSSELYVMLLATLRLKEGQAQNWLVHYLTEQDLQYLVETIWHGQSCISGCRDLKKLLVTRFDMHTWLAPWNAMVVTVEEAQTHATLHPSHLYSPIFLKSVQRKCELAKQHWARLHDLYVKVMDRPQLQSQFIREWKNEKGESKASTTDAS